jgi:hypothetical protein
LLMVTASVIDRSYKPSNVHVDFSLALMTVEGSVAGHTTTALSD